MLVQANDIEKAVSAVAEEKTHAFILKFWGERREQTDQPPGTFLTDDNAEPSVLVVRQGANFSMLARELAGYRRLADDLLNERIEQDPPWPDEKLREDWEQWVLAKGLFMNASPLVLWEMMHDAGFEPDPNERKQRHAYLWTIEGEPRFGDMMKHRCRLGEGEELWELLRQGITYDSEGEYVRKCLRRGPSFVCEVDGERVCWASTHLNGTMGMIYTPPPHRRQGYARSLAAFQIDHMLKTYGVACAHVVSTNVESESMMRSLGARRIHEPVVWRTLYWPGEAEKAQRRRQEIMKQRQEQKQQT